MDHSTEFLRNFETARSKRYLDLDKKQFHLLTGFLTGHCHLRKYLLRMGLSDIEECRFCGEEEETSIHLVTKLSEELASLKPSQILDFIRSLESLEMLAETEEANIMEFG